MPKVTIDGRTIEVEQGTTILNAARKLGIDIPVFCYHEGLSVAANCRMCLVEVKGVSKPVPSCEVQVRDGMEVFTQSEFAKNARRHTVEFILLNHPVDCPICDQAGECVLQEHYHTQDYKPSRINIKKVRKAKVVTLGPTVVLDRERCINCTRCVRFCREISKSGQLVQIKRGNQTEISLFPGKVFDDPYSLCAVDVCPVGALTSVDFRFKQRVWWLKSGRTICPECSRGCNLLVDYKDDRIYRLRPYANPEVNQFWACDEGRLAFHRFETGRLATCRVRRAGVVEETAFEAALTAAAELLRSWASKPVLLVLPLFSSMEEAFAALTFGLRVLQQRARFYFAERKSGSADDLLRMADRNPNRAGILKLAQLLGIQPVTADELRAGLAGGFGGALVLGDEFDRPQGTGADALESIVLSAKDGPLVQASSVAFAIPTHFERNGTFLNATGQLQSGNRVLPLPAYARSTHVVLAKLARELDADLGYTDFGGLRSLLFDKLGMEAPALTPVAASHP